MNQRDQIRSADQLTMHGRPDGRAMMAEGITVQSSQHKAFAGTCDELALRRGVDWNHDSNSCN